MGKEQKQTDQMWLEAGTWLEADAWSVSFRRTVGDVALGFFSHGFSILLKKETNGDEMMMIINI